MADTPLGEGPKSIPAAAEPRLESWGEIATYLRREIRTVQRWEKYYGLPVHRLRTGSVYAYRSELDKWYKERQPSETDSEEPAKTNGETRQKDKIVLEPAQVSPQPTPPIPQRKIRLRWVLVGAALLIITGAVAYSIVSPPQKVRLFVRPFTDNGQKAGQDEFLSGLTQETIAELGKIDPMHVGVIAPTTSEVLAAKPIDELGRLLNVQYVLEGAVSRNGDQVRIDAHLVSVRDQTNIWSNSYTNNLRDILHVQDEVSRAVADAIRTKLPAVSRNGSANLKKVTGIVNPDAYEAYLTGRADWAKRDLLGSLEAYQLALQKDPDYTLARAGLASTYLLLGQVPNDAMKPNDAMPKAREAAQRALAADPNNAEAHCVLANIAMSYDWNFGAAEREFQRAIALDLNNSTAHEWYGHYLIVRQRLSEAQREMSSQLDLDPISPTIRAENRFYARDYDGAIVQARHTLDQYPSFWLANFWLASAYREKKMYPQAIQEFDQLRKFTGGRPAMLLAYGHALAVSGDKTRAKQVLTALDGIAKTRYVPAVYFAVMYVGLGDSDSAFTWFDKALEERNDRLVYLAVDPMVDPVRSDPRFGKLLARIGLP